MIDVIHKYVVTVWFVGPDVAWADRDEKFMLEMYSAADAVTAVRTWIDQNPPFARSAKARVTHVEAYNEERHGQWFVQPGGPGRSRG